MAITRWGDADITTHRTGRLWQAASAGLGVRDGGSPAAMADRPPLPVTVVVPTVGRSTLARLVEALTAALAALESLHPDLFVKGGDYSVDTLPETPVLARWGGRTVTVPYLSGRSTSRIVSEASRHGA
jgi:hypothetical protein